MTGQLYDIYAGWPARGCLLLADTNNHGIRMTDFAATQVRTFTLSDLWVR